MKLLRRLLWVVLAIPALILIAGCWPYIIFPVYHFPQPTPFAGDSLYNPYAGAHGRWWKANFHAHAHAWGGLTAGQHSGAEVVRFYRKMGYDIAGLSNYMSINGRRPGDPDFIPIYEHGYNVWKVHQLVIGASRVTWLDFPFGQTLSEKQYMLDRLEKAGGVIAVAHPWLRNGYPVSQLRYLTNYPLMEVVRQGHAGVDRYDAALSAGHLSWVIGDDDSHNIDDPNNTGLSWTMVRAPSLHRTDILAALRAGHTYAVRGRHGANDIELRDVALHGDTLTVTTDPGALAFRFVGQGGAVLKLVHDSMQASYVVRPSDTYVRTVVLTPHTRMYLNPIVRWNGVALARPTATLDRTRMWLYRVLFLVGLVVLVGLIRGYSRRRRRGRGRGRTGPPAGSEGTGTVEV